jgi:enoyl-CoA hydratase/carnithine racemase
MKVNFLIILLIIISSIICDSLIIYEEVDNIGIITFNRTSHLNALNTTVFDHLLNAINALDASKISALIITGAG